MLLFTQHLQLILLLTSSIGLMQSKQTKINLQKLLQLFNKRMKRELGNDSAGILISSGILTVNDNKRHLQEDWHSTDIAPTSQQIWTTTIPLTKETDDLAHIIGLKPPTMNSVSEYISYSPGSDHYDSYQDHHHHLDHYYHPPADDYIYNSEVLANDFLEPLDLLLTESKLPKGISVDKDHLVTTRDFLANTKHYIKSYGK